MIEFKDLKVGMILTNRNNSFQNQKLVIILNKYQKFVKVFNLDAFLSSREDALNNATVHIPDIRTIKRGTYIGDWSANTSGAGTFLSVDYRRLKQLRSSKYLRDFIKIIFNLLDIRYERYGAARTIYSDDK